MITNVSLIFSIVLLAIHLKFLDIFNRVTCRTIDVTDNQATMRPAEFKYQSFLSKWHTIKSVADINVKFNIPVSCEKSRLEAQITVS